MHLKQPPLLIALTILLLSFTNHGSAGQCIEQPQLKCLHLHIEQQIEQLEHQGVPISGSTRESLAYESEQRYGKAPATLPPDSLSLTLQKEDEFIRSVTRNELSASAGNIIQQPFHDTLAPTGGTLLIEKLTLQLQDHTAEEIKRSQLEQVLAAGTTPNTTLIRLARHEILGGAPAKGLATLSNTRIDEFSDTNLYTEKRALTELGHTASTLFLNPEAANINCEQDSNTTMSSMIRFFSTTHQTLLKSLWNTPDIQHAWKNQLTLSLLYKNAESCTLFVELHVNQLIQSAQQYQSANEQDVINLIQLARAIRRYLS